MKIIACIRLVLAICVKCKRLRDYAFHTIITLPIFAGNQYLNFMASRTITAERYTKILELFKISCIEERGEALSALCRAHNIPYKGLLYWMQNQGMTVKSIKKIYL